MRRILLCLSALSLSSCGLNVPPPPETWLCQVNDTPRAFYCKNTKTKERKLIAIDDPSMKAAQCLSADDFKKSEAYVMDLIDLAKKQCK